MRFGVQIEPQFGFSYDDVRAVAQRAEASGFYGLWCSDHFFLNDASEEINCLECWTVLAALARDTKSLRLGPLVSCTSYRHPALLAKVAASIDHLSGGRLEFGLGAGWKEIEYAAFGFRFPSAGARGARLAGALHVVKAMWTQPKASYAGEFYTIKDAFCAPKPTQKPHPPIWVGGGKPRVLDICARHADGINFIPFPTPEQYAEKLEALKRACQRHGRDPDAVRKSHFTQMFIAETEAEVEAMLAQAAQRRNTTVEKLRQALAPGFVGTPEQCAAQIRRYGELGVDTLMLMFPYQTELDGVRLVGQHLVPEFS